MIVHGRVQGVGFRFFTQQLAAEHNVAGWVKNLYDGNVEIHAEGEKNNIEAFIHAIKTNPSPFARVNQIETIYRDNVEGFSTFKIKY